MTSAFSRVLLASVAAATLPIPSPSNLVTPAEAAQPWSCVCKGEKKRFLASTRHCEKRMGLAKGQWCSKKQHRAVYGPACMKRGCQLP